MSSTFRDFNRVDKESVIIDTIDGNTTQKVKFSNVGNQFYGTFTGDIVLSDDTFTQKLEQDMSSKFQQKGNYLSVDQISGLSNLSSMSIVRLWGRYRDGNTFSFYVLSGQDGL